MGASRGRAVGWAAARRTAWGPGPCSLSPVLPAALRRTWRISNSYAAISANDGHAAITRPVAVGSATATFAARLATLPTTSSAHGRTPPLLPDRESASSVLE